MISPSRQFSFLQLHISILLDIMIQPDGNLDKLHPAAQQSRHDIITSRFLICKCFFYIFHAGFARSVTVQPCGWYCPAPRERCANLAVRETGVNSTVREDGEHFCEVPERKFYIRRPNKREDCDRRPNKNENAARDRVEPHGWTVAAVVKIFHILIDTVGK